MKTYIVTKNDQFGTQFELKGKEISIESGNIVVWDYPENSAPLAEKVGIFPQTFSVHLKQD